MPWSPETTAALNLPSKRWQFLRNANVYLGYPTQVQITPLLVVLRYARSFSLWCSSSPSLAKGSQRIYKEHLWLSRRKCLPSNTLVTQSHRLYVEFRCHIVPFVVIIMKNPVNTRSCGQEVRHCRLMVWGGLEIKDATAAWRSKNTIHRLVCFFNVSIYSRPQKKTNFSVIGIKTFKRYIPPCEHLLKPRD